MFVSRDLHSEFIVLGLDEFVRPAFKPLVITIVISYVDDEVAAIAVLAIVNSAINAVKDEVIKVDQRTRVRHFRFVALSYGR